MKKIYVRVADAATGQVALWERHPEHPDGEVFLSGPGTYEVAVTPAVEARLRNGRLVKVETAAAPASADTPEPKPDASPKSKKAAPAQDRGGL